MNIKYLLVVSLATFLLLPKSSFAQAQTTRTTSLDIMSLEPYADEIEEPARKDVNNPQTLRNATPTRGMTVEEFKYRWYIQVAGGAQLLMAEDDSKGSFKSRVTLAPSLTIGYRFSPVFGVRLNFTGGSVHGYNDGHSGTYRFWKDKSDEFKQAFATENNLTQGINNIERWDPQWNYRGWTINGLGQWNGDMSNTKQIQYDHNTTPGGYNWAPGTPKSANENGGNLYMQHVRYVAAHAALTVNLFNLIGGADDSRKFDASIHVGPSFFHVIPHMGVEAYNGFGVNGGLQAQYHLSNKFGILAEVNGALLPDGFDGHYGDSSFDLIGQTLLGISYKFPIGESTFSGKRGYMDEAMDDELRRIRAELMREINQMQDLQPEIERLRKQLAELSYVEKKELIDPSLTSFFYPAPLHFQIGKSDIDTKGFKVIEEVADYLNNHPSALVIVTGFADKDTGTGVINEKLSRERSKKVADALQYKFHIDRDRVAIDWRGDSVQPFFQNQRNRAVLFYIEFE